MANSRNFKELGMLDHRVCVRGALYKMTKLERWAGVRSEGPTVSVTC